MAYFSNMVRDTNVGFDVRTLTFPAVAPAAAHNPVSLYAAQTAKDSMLMVG